MEEENVESKNSKHGLATLRIALGLLFLIPGISKLMGPEGITGMLTGLGFPAPAFFAWILIISEIAFGLSLIVGWKTRFAVWPLFIVLTVATLLVAIPGIDITNPGSAMGTLWHLLGLAGLLTIYLSGPGSLSVNKR